MAFWVRLTGLCWLAAAAAGLACWCAQPLTFRHESSALAITGTDFHFLSGQPLERLHDGASVIFAVRLTLFTNQKTTVFRREAGRFAVSFDLWEEKFAVTHLRKPQNSATHLTADKAEAWCLNSLPVAVSDLPASTLFWVRLDIRAEDPSESSSPNEDTGFDLARLVELFSRPASKEQPRWQQEGGPFRLRDFR